MINLLFSTAVAGGPAVKKSMAETPSSSDSVWKTRRLPIAKELKDATSDTPVLGVVVTHDGQPLAYNSYTRAEHDVDPPLRHPPEGMVFVHSGWSFLSSVKSVFSQAGHPAYDRRSPDWEWMPSHFDFPDTIEDLLDDFATRHHGGPLEALGRIHITLNEACVMRMLPDLRGVKKYSHDMDGMDDAVDWRWDELTEAYGLINPMRQHPVHALWAFKHLVARYDPAGEALKQVFSKYVKDHLDDFRAFYPFQPPPADAPKPIVLLDVVIDEGQPCLLEDFQGILPA